MGSWAEESRLIEDFLMQYCGYCARERFGTKCHLILATGEIRTAGSADGEIAGSGRHSLSRLAMSLLLKRRALLADRGYDIDAIISSSPEAGNSGG